MLNDLDTIIISKAANGYIVQMPVKPVDPFNRLVDMAKQMTDSIKGQEMDDIEKLIRAQEDRDDMEPPHTDLPPSTFIFTEFGKVLGFLDEHKF